MDDGPTVEVCELPDELPELDKTVEGLIVAAVDESTVVTDLLSDDKIEAMLIIDDAELDTEDDTAEETALETDAELDCDEPVPLA